MRGFFLVKMGGMKLNAKREKACQAYMLDGGNKSSAYCETYPTSRKRKNETVNVRACELFSESEVQGRVLELEEQAGFTPILRTVELRAICPL